MRVTSENLAIAEMSFVGVFFGFCSRRGAGASDLPRAASSVEVAMPPKKKAVQATARIPLPQPNLWHPCASLLPSALASSTLADRPHPPSYHCFVTSPFSPSTPPTTDEPPRKRSRVSSAAAKLPPALDAAIEAVVLQQKLLTWFDDVKEKRGMPWRKEINPNTLTRKEKNRRGYEASVCSLASGDRRGKSC